ncbi:MAG: hypothetical protein WCP29_13785 [Acidobacteriota bacterium]
MNALYQTPLLDCVRRGEVASDIRLLAAQGVLAPRALEQLALLVWLVNDSDPLIGETAEATIGRIPRAMVERFLRNPDVPDDVRTFFSQRGVSASGPAADAADADEVLHVVAEVSDKDDQAPSADELPNADQSSEAATDEDVRASTVQRLAKLTITQRLKAAMRGNREERAYLIRDSNKLVSISVLSSSRLTEQEVETFAKMASLSEDVLRVIGTTRAWVKNYAVVRGLMFNPKTPVAVSMGMVNRLIEKDVKMLASDRNIAEPVKLLARKMMQAGQSRKR